MKDIKACHGCGNEMQAPYTGCWACGYNTNFVSKMVLVEPKEGSSRFRDYPFGLPIRSYDKKP